MGRLEELSGGIRQPRIVFFALRDLWAGDQLNFTYAEDSTLVRDFNCGCYSCMATRNELQQVRSSGMIPRAWRRGMSCNRCAASADVLVTLQCRFLAAGALLLACLLVLLLDGAGL